jgi:hypothetical protein
MENPLTYNWNKVFIAYCDGASFSGSADEPVYSGDYEYMHKTYNGKMLYFRGNDILEAVYDSLLKNHGMSKASEVLVSGSSAGGLTVLLHLDKIRNMIIDGNRIEGKPLVLGVPDAGFFLDVKSFEGRYKMRDAQGMMEMYKYQNSKNSLNPQCLHKQTEDDKWKCMLPEYFVQYIKTPLFLVQSYSDGWQFGSNFDLDCERENCDKHQIEYLETIQEKFESTIQRLPYFSSYFVTRCIYHTMVNHVGSWLGTPIRGKILRDQLIGWYHDKKKMGERYPTHKWNAFDSFWTSNDLNCPGQNGYKGSIDIDIGLGDLIRQTKLEDGHHADEDKDPEEEKESDKHKSNAVKLKTTKVKKVVKAKNEYKNEDENEDEKLLRMTRTSSKKNTKNLRGNTKRKTTKRDR